MTFFTAVAGMSIYDVCLSTYGRLDNLARLMQNNSFENADRYPQSGESFGYDETLVENSQAPVKVYATANLNNGGLFPFPYIPPITVNYKEVTKSTSFTSGADGATVLNITDDDGNPIYGFDIVIVIHETKPYFKTQYLWNKDTSVLTLKNTSLDKDETAFIIYTKTA